MSKKKQNNWQDHYWQSALINSISYQTYRDWILSLAINRYRWLNLPSTCDSRYLEYILAMEGCATIARPESGLQNWVSTKATSGKLNIYDNPTEWDSTGNNGWNFHVTPLNGVLIWDNALRTPIWNNIHLWSLRLAEFDRVLDVNLQQQKIPWVFTAPQEKVLDVTNMLKQAMGGEPAVLGIKGIENIGVNLLTTPIDFKGEELQLAKQRVWNEIYTFLGISNVDQKQERMIESEVKENDDPTDIRALDGLKARRDAARYLNEHFGLNIKVVWNRDLESQNYNYKMNMEQREENGETK